MVERKPQGRLEYERIPLTELGPEVQAVIDSYKNVLRETPDVSRVLVDSFLEPEKPVVFIGQEGAKGRNIRFNKGDSSYTICLDLDEGTTSMNVDRYTIRDGRPDMATGERLRARVVRDVDSNDIFHAQILYADHGNPIDGDWHSDNGRAINGAKKFLNKLRKGR